MQKILYCYGYCNAQSYDIKLIKSYFLDNQIQVKKIDNAFYVFYKDVEEVIEFFYFPFGSVVIWGLNEEKHKQILSVFDKYRKSKLHVLRDKHLYESETIKCEYSADYQTDSIDEEQDLIKVKSDDIFTKLAISYALAQSVKLSFLENSVAQLLKNTEPIHEELAMKGNISLSKREISKKIGILFQERYAINVHSDALDIPEIFWKMPSYEPLYIMTTKLQDIQARHSILNKRLHMVEGLYNMLTNELNVKHSSRLEVVIVILITIEVILGLLAHISSLFKSFG